MGTLKSLLLKVNPEDALTGAMIPLIFLYWLKWFVLLASPLSALLWVLGGVGFLGTKLWRRLGVPIVISTCHFLSTHHMIWLWIPIGWLILSIGYGTPEGDSKPSFLGKFFWDMTKGNVRLTNILTRGTIYLLLLASFILIVR